MGTETKESKDRDSLLSGYPGRFEDLVRDLAGV